MNELSLKEQLLAANLDLEENDFANHESDLYVVNKPGVAAWLKKNYEHYSNITSFYSDGGSNWGGAGKRCLDIPFVHVKKEKKDV